MQARRFPGSASLPERRPRRSRRLTQTKGVGPDWMALLKSQNLAALQILPFQLGKTGVVWYAGYG
jgi:hypothetical protein